MFSLWIRQSRSENGEVECITCDKILPWRETDAGHFASSRHAITRYDERNVEPQCRHCNRFDQGRQYEFGVSIDGKHGPGTADKILQKSRGTKRISQREYRELIQELKSKLTDGGYDVE